MKLSAALISFNEESNLERTLAPLRLLADEIVLVDCFSSDRTPELAAALGAKVFQEPWAGYIAQKNSALSKCSGDWLLSLDCDEELTPELAGNIRSALAQDTPNVGYILRRRTFYQGRLLRYAWQPDKHLRLVRRDASARWAGSDPHESLQVEGPVATLPGFLLHYPYKDFHSHMEKSLRYAQGMAQHYLRQGKKAGWADLLLRPPLTLGKRLFLKGALLDGTPGIMAALSGAAYVYMKYALLWEARNSDGGAKARDGAARSRQGTGL